MEVERLTNPKGSTIEYLDWCIPGQGKSYEKTKCSLRILWIDADYLHNFGENSAAEVVVHCSTVLEEML